MARGRPKGALNLSTRKLLAANAIAEVESGKLMPMKVVLDLVRDLDQDGRPLHVWQDGKWIENPEARPYTERQERNAWKGLDFTTPKLIAVKMQIEEKPDPKLELLRLMTLDERRRFRELLTDVQSRQDRPVIDATAVEVVIEDDEEGDG